MEIRDPRNLGSRRRVTIAPGVRDVYGLGIAVVLVGINRPPLRRLGVQTLRRETLSVFEVYFGLLPVRRRTTHGSPNQQRQSMG